MAPGHLLLLIEDSDADSEATVRALQKCAPPLEIHRSVDGGEALDFLRKRAARAAISPSVILLDLNLPGIDGREVLEEIKADVALKHIPVVILTTSSDSSDLQFCYRNGASGYMTKPVDLDEFAKAVKDFYAYWFETVVLPELGEGRPTMPE